jgi:hypothetical protein
MSSTGWLAKSKIPLTKRCVIRHLVQLSLFHAKNAYFTYLHPFHIFSSTLLSPSRRFAVCHFSTLVPANDTDGWLTTAEHDERDDATLLLITRLFSLVIATLRLVESRRLPDFLSWTAYIDEKLFT